MRAQHLHAPAAPNESERDTQSEQRCIIEASAAPAARCRGRNAQSERCLGGLPIGVLRCYGQRRLAGLPEPEIDELIGAHSTGWALDRLSAVDRQILRLSTFELVALEDLPLAVVIDEAVELAKLYSTEDSARFVNGVLSAIAAEVRTTEQIPT